MSRHFGDMLLERRRQMGASIQQVSNIVRIKPQIIEYFETENFAAMPPRGYAQGMISSYARFLGLNPREVVDAYFDALHEYENGSGGRVGRFQDAAADASPRSSNAPARYMMVNSVPSSRFAQRPPQAGYVSESTSAHEPMSTARLRPASGPNRTGQSGYDPSLRSRTNGRDAGYGRPRYDGGRPAPRNGYPQGHPSSPDPRGPRNGGAPRSRSGAPYERGYREVPAGGRRPDSRGGGRPPQGGRSSRGPQGPAFDPRLIFAGAIAILLVMLIAGFLLLRGCAPKPAPSTGSTNGTPARVESAADDGADDGDPDAPAGEDTQPEDGADEQKPAAKEEPKETIVKVSLKEKGVAAWVEVKLDGKIVLGKQVVGPFEEQFTVSSQVDITTDKPASVSVYKNGDKVRYDTKVSGVGKVTIVAPKKEEPDEKVVDSDGDGTPDMTAEEARAAGLPVPSQDQNSPAE